MQAAEATEGEVEALRATGASAQRPSGWELPEKLQHFAEVALLAEVEHPQAAVGAVAIPEVAPADQAAAVEPWNADSRYQATKCSARRGPFHSLKRAASGL